MSSAAEIALSPPEDAALGYWVRTRRTPLMLTRRTVRIERSMQRVEASKAAPTTRHRRALGRADDVADRVHQLRRIERFAHDGDGRIEDADADLPCRGDDDEGNVRTLGAGDFDDAIAARARHHQIDQGDVELFRTQQVDGLAAVARFENFKAFSLEERLDEAANAVGIFSDECSFHDELASEAQEAVQGYPETSEVELLE